MIILEAALLIEAGWDDLCGNYFELKMINIKSYLFHI